MARIINWLIGLNLLFLAFAVATKFLTGHFEVGLITWSGLILSLLFGIALFLKKNKSKARLALYVFIMMYFFAIFIGGIFAINLMALSPVIALGLLISIIYGFVTKQILLDRTNLVLICTSSAVLLISLLFKVLHWQYANAIFIIAAFIGAIWVIYHYMVQRPSN